MARPLPKALLDQIAHRACATALSPELLALLHELKQQVEEDAVTQDHLIGWCRSLPRLIEQDAMPKAWDKLVAYLKEHGHAV